MKQLDIRNKMKKKKPDFIRQDTHKKKRLAKNWRKPRGIDSKLRLQLKGKGKLVKVGYKSPKSVRGLNREGLKEVLICNVADLKKIEEGMIGVISATVGTKKKIGIIKKATEDKIKLSNYTEQFIKKKKKKQKQRKEEEKQKEEKKKEKAKIEKEEKQKEDTKKTESDVTKNKPEDKSKPVLSQEEIKKKEIDKALIKKGAV